MVEIADNFQRQYSHLFPERRPLLLCPENENGVKVMSRSSSTTTIIITYL